MTTTKTSASAVSAYLGRVGYQTADATQWDGLHVSSFGDNGVTVSAHAEVQRRAVTLIDQVRQALVDGGYVIDTKTETETFLVVTGRAL